LVDAAVVAAAAAVWAAAGARWFLAQGYTLYYGDAQAHLNIARRIVDSRTPNYDQIGTVWLPLPHLLMLPFVGNDVWWRTGMAGAIPGAACLALGLLFFYLAVRRALGSRAAAATAMLVLALNPNLLYLSSAPMTEPVFFAALAGLLYATVAFGQTQSWWALGGAAVAALAGTLTRYEGWFLLPFVTLYVLAAGRGKRVAAATVFAAVAALGPLYWLAHNWWEYGNVLEFYDGPYSAQAIYQRALATGMSRYPGDHDLRKAAECFAAAARLCAGLPLVVLGLAGMVAALLRRAWWPVVLLSLPAVFYVASIYSSGTPIFVPQLWPNSYYNTRYGLAALPAAAFGAAALAAWGSGRVRAVAAVAVISAAVAVWVAYPHAESWICWKESQVNSEARRAWTKEAAEFLKPRYRTGAGVAASFGDLTGIFARAGIPLPETLHDGNNPHWMAVLGRPDLFLWEEWAVAISGDEISTAVQKLDKPNRRGPHYHCVKIITVKGGPAIEIYQRSSGAPAVEASNHEDPVPEGARRQE
jgi:hypothetical protein